MLYNQSTDTDLIVFLLEYVFLVHFWQTVKEKGVFISIEILRTRFSVYMHSETL